MVLGWGHNVNLSFLINLSHWKIFKRYRDSLVVQWLGLGAFTAEDLGLIPGGGTKIPQALPVWPEKKKRYKKSDLIYAPGHVSFTVVSSDWSLAGAHHRKILSFVYLTPVSYFVLAFSGLHPLLFLLPLFFHQENPAFLYLGNCKCWSSWVTS